MTTAREGVDFILDPMYQKIPDDLFEHIDGLWNAFKPINDDEKGLGD